MSNLYEINNDLNQMIFNSVDEDGVINEALEYEIDDLFKAKEEKLLNCAKYIKNELAFIDMLAAEEKSLFDRRRSIEKRVVWMKTYMVSNMEAGEKVKDAQAEVGTRKSVVVNITDTSLLLDKYVKIIPESKSPDKVAIKKGFKTSEVAGAELIERLNVTIK